jgi:hypothetical protein
VTARGPGETLGSTVCMHAPPTWTERRAVEVERAHHIIRGASSEQRGKRDALHWALALR